MPYHYAEFAWHFKRLARAYKEGQLVLVLGAGVSRPYEHPLWPDLVQNLLLESGRVPRLRVPRLGRRTSHSDASSDAKERAEKQLITKMFEHLIPDTLLQGAVAHAAYPSKRWRYALKKQLGPGKVGRPDTTATGVLRLIAEMMVASLVDNPRLHLSIISFNYDSLLDEAIGDELEANELPRSFVHSIKTEHDYERTWVDAGIYIYHLHGYLPDDERDPILDADSYVPVLRGDHWSWRCMDRILTATGVASLFIGLSLSDPSLRYVLTLWKSWQSPMTGVYLAPPPKLPGVGWSDGRAVALMYRAVMDLYATVLGRLHLACYYLSSFREIRAILEVIGERS